MSHAPSQNSCIEKSSVRVALLLAAVVGTALLALTFSGIFPDSDPLIYSCLAGGVFLITLPLALLVLSCKRSSETDRREQAPQHQEVEKLLSKSAERRAPTAPKATAVPKAGRAPEPRAEKGPSAPKATAAPKAGHDPDSQAEKAEEAAAAAQAARKNHPPRPSEDSFRFVPNVSSTQEERAGWRALLEADLTQTFLEADPRSTTHYSMLETLIVAAHREMSGRARVPDIDPPSGARLMDLAAELFFKMSHSRQDRFLTWLGSKSEVLNNFAFAVRHNSTLHECPRDGVPTFLTEAEIEREKIVANLLRS